MQSKRILVPVDLGKAESSFDVLQFVEGMAGGLAVDATLLHVVHLNIACGERRVYDELCAESEARLRGLARLFLNQCRTVGCRVRLGCPHEEIVAEAESEQTELIILSSLKASRWKRFLGSKTVERVVRNAPCPTLVLPRAWRITPEQDRQTMRPSYAVALTQVRQPERENQFCEASGRAFHWVLM